MVLNRTVVIQTMKTVYATLHSVFPFIETWQTSDGDYLLVCSGERLTYSRDLLERRIGVEPREFVSTDDRMVVEFGLLRTMGRKNLGMMQAQNVEAVTNQLHRPFMSDGTIDWAEVRDQDLLSLTLSNLECKTIDDPERGFLLRVAAHTNFRRDSYRAANDPLLPRAEADLREYHAGEPNRGGTDSFLK